MGKKLENTKGQGSLQVSLRAGFVSELGGRNLGGSEEERVRGVRPREVVSTLPPCVLLTGFCSNLFEFHEANLMSHQIS